jgi:hypothetical protein
VLISILLLHALRHLGLMFLAPDAVYAGIPAAFATPAAYGDLIAALLALASIAALVANAKAARAGVGVQHRRDRGPGIGDHACHRL